MTTTDASIISILSQIDDGGKEKIIYSYSKRLDKTQENYSTTDKELMAIIKSLE